MPSPKAYSNMIAAEYRESGLDLRRGQQSAIVNV